MSQKRLDLIIAENPHIKFGNSLRRGYTTMELSAKRCTTRFRTVYSVTDPNSNIRDLATFSVESGRPGAQRA